MGQETQKRNNTKPIVLTIIGILIVLLITLGIVYKLRAGNPVTMTTAALERFKEGYNLNDNLGKTLSFIEEADVLETNMTGKVTLPMNYGTLNLDMLLQEDSDAREAVMNLDLDINGESMYLEGQLDRNALYFAFKENASKYYYLNDLYYPELDDIDYEDIIEYFKESFEEVVKPEDFKESDSAILVNGENLKSKQYSLGLSELLVTKITNRFVEKLLNDAELINALAKMSGMTEAEIREELNNMKVSRDELGDLDSEAEVLYNIYVAKNRPVRFEFADVDSDNKFYIDNYKNVEIKFDSIDDYGDVITISIVESNNNWTIKVDSTDLKVNGTINENKYDLTLTAEDASIVINGTEEYKFSNNNVSVVEKGNIKITSEGASIEIPFEFNISFKEIEKVNLKNTTNKVDINNMTTEQENELANELMQIPLISSLLVGQTPDYSYDEDYYYNVDSDYSYDDIFDYGYGY